jgi:hypothetical protein
MELVKFVKVIGNKIVSKVVSMPDNWIAAKESEKGFLIDNQLVNKNASIILNTEWIKSSKWIVQLENNDDLRLATREEFDDFLCRIIYGPDVLFFYSRETAYSSNSIPFSCYVKQANKDINNFSFEHFLKQRSLYEQFFCKPALSVLFMQEKEEHVKRLERITKDANKKWEEYQKTVNERIGYDISFLKTMDWKIEETSQQF